MFSVGYFCVVCLKLARLNTCNYFNTVFIMVSRIPNKIIVCFVKHLKLWFITKLFYPHQMWFIDKFFYRDNVSWEIYSIQFILVYSLSFWWIIYRDSSSLIAVLNLCQFYCYLVIFIFFFRRDKNMANDMKILVGLMLGIIHLSNTRFLEKIWIDKKYDRRLKNAEKKSDTLGIVILQREKNIDIFFFCFHSWWKKRTNRKKM